MDTRSGHIVRDIEALEPELRERYTPVPFHLRHAARDKLAGHDEATVDVNGRSALARWARNMEARSANKKAKRDARRKVANRSRQRNRS